MHFRLLHLILAVFPLAVSAAVPNRYIVEMSGEPVAVHVARRARFSGMRGAAAIQRRSEIRQQQGGLRTRIESAEGRVLDSVDTVANALVVNIADDNAAQLRSMPGVVRVYPVRIFKPLLDRAVIVHRVTDAWRQVGIDNAGAGMKIAIIDTGIDVQHAGFQDASLPVPSGFPRANTEEDLAFTNPKVIVARSYEALFARPDPDPSPRDRVGHGTATAMAAAGGPNTGPLAAISGVAPKAQLGNYKVFGSPGVNDGATDAAILKAIDDAVADGMDVISLSLGTVEATRIEDDIEVAALERAAELGVIIVVAAGNEGPDPNTIGSPGTAPSAITVGASRNDRVFGASAAVGEAAPVLAIPRSDAASLPPVTGPLASVAALDEDGLACLPFPSRSLEGRIAFILRGTCTFEEKLNHAHAAGAIGALIYTDETRPDPIEMSVGVATLPASMVGYAAGVEIRRKLAEAPSLTATLSFTIGPVIVSVDGLVDFSSRGPNVDLAIKPDLLAVGTSFYTATQTADVRGSMFNAGGYTMTQGTSFSTPFVAGAAALLKAARPGLTMHQYRSLLINTAGAAAGTAQQAGAGALDLSAALRGSAAAFPTALSFQSGGGDPHVARDLTISNVGTGPAAFRLEAVSVNGAPLPSLESGNVTLDPGAAARIGVTFSAFSLAPGQYEGFIRVTDTSSGLESHVPYWYAVRSDTPQFITVLDVRNGASPLASVRDAVLFRITDASGLPMSNVEPAISVVSGDGTVTSVDSLDNLIPGAYGITLRLGPRRGSNVVRIEAGAVAKEVTVSSR